MPIYIPYIVVVLLASIASFAAISHGSYFTEIVKSLFAILSLISLVAFSITSAIQYSWLHVLGLIFAYLLSIFIVPLVFRPFYCKAEPPASFAAEPQRDFSQLNRIIAEYAFDIAKLGENTSSPDLSSVLCATSALIHLLYSNDIITDDTVKLLFTYTFDHVQAFLPPSFPRARIAELLLQYYTEAERCTSPLEIKIKKPCVLYGIEPTARFLSSRFKTDALVHEISEKLRAFLSEAAIQ